MSAAKKRPPSTPEDLLRRVLREFPALQPKTYRLVADGWDHEVLIIDDRIVFRFPNDDEYLAALKNEIKVLRELAPFLKVNMPRYTYVAKDCSFAGYQIVPGTFVDVDLFKTWSLAKQGEFAKQLADFLTSMHAMLHGGIDLGMVPGTYIYEDQAQLKVRIKRYLPGVLTHQELAAVDEIMADIDALLMEDMPTALLHGDVYSQHLLWDEATGKLGIIDFSDMMRGDPAIDFAELYEYGEAFVHAVYEHYKGQKDKMFLGRAWKYQRWVGVYMMADHFVYHKTSFGKARATFDRTTKNPGQQSSPFIT